MSCAVLCCVVLCCVIGQLLLPFCCRVLCCVVFGWWLLCLLCVAIGCLVVRRSFGFTICDRRSERHHVCPHWRAALWLISAKRTCNGVLRRSWITFYLLLYAPVIAFVVRGGLYAFFPRCCYLVLGKLAGNKCIWCRIGSASVQCDWDVSVRVALSNCTPAPPNLLLSRT